MVNGTRVSELQRYINQLHLARKRCERRIEALGGQRHWVRAVAHLDPQRAAPSAQRLTRSCAVVLGAGRRLTRWTSRAARTTCSGAWPACPCKRCGLQGTARVPEGSCRPRVPFAHRSWVVWLADLPDLSIQHGHVLLHGVYGAQQGPRQAPVLHACKQVWRAVRGRSPCRSRR